MPQAASASLRRCYRRIVAQSDRMIAILDGAGPALDARCADLSVWSVAEHLEHLGITSNLTLDLFKTFEGENGTASDAAEGTPNFWGRMVLLTGRIPLGRGRARAEWKPLDASPRRARQSIEDLRRRLPLLEKHLGAIESSSRRVRHPALGDFNGRQWVRFLFIHQHHHLRIIGTIARRERRAS